MATVFITKGLTDLTSLGIASGDSVRSLEGAQTITAGSNFSAVGGLTEVYQGPASSINFPSTSPLRTGANIGATQMIRREGGGTWYVHTDDSGSNIIARYQNTGTGKNYFVTGGTVTSLEIGSGYNWVSADVAVTGVWQSGGQIDQQYSATRNTTWNISGGQFNTGRGFGTSADISGGIVHVRRENTSATLPTTSATAVLRLTAGGVLKWAGGNLCAGGTLTVQGGVLDMSDVPVSMSAGTLTITAASRKVSVLESKTPGVVVTFTSITERIGEAAATPYGGTPGYSGPPGSPAMGA